MNPVSHSLSRFTFVRSSGVLSGRPPFGGTSRSSGCCAYRSRNALVRPPFCSAVTLGWNLKHAMRVTGESALEADMILEMGGGGREAQVISLRC
jgi:hypothetical protein